MTSPAARWVLSCDGGARGNPGPGAFGYVLRDPAGALREERSERIGIVTNNMAEYRSLLAGLEAARRLGARRLEVRMDSELVVRQMMGAYRVKSAGLKPLYEAARRSAAQFEEVNFISVRREDNRRADALVNEALDALGDPVPESPR